MNFKNNQKNLVLIKGWIYRNNWLARRLPCKRKYYIFDIRPCLSELLLNAVNLKKAKNVQI